jgi:site-specific recombinase XerD
LTGEEAARLVNACSRRASTGIRNRALITVLYRGGFRISEALQLVESDLSRSARLIHLSRKLRPRIVGLDAGSCLLIDRWIERRAELGMSTSSRLFCTLRGEPISTSYVRALLTRLARRAGIHKRVSAEMLRRTLASELAQEGFPVRFIQAQLGHASAATTSRYLAALASHDALGAASEAMQRRSDWQP